MSNISAMMPLDQTIQEVKEQPAVVSVALCENHPAVVKLAAHLCEKNIRACKIVGAGDSMFVGQSVQQAFHMLAGVPMSVSQSYEFAVFEEAGIDERTAIFVISSSGRQSTTRDALERALNSNAFVVGVTDVKRADNPFYYKPTCVLVPGAKKAGWPTQTTTATIALFLDLAIEMGRINGKLSADEADTKHRELFGLPKLMDEILIQFRPLVSQIASKFVSTNAVYFIGSGPGYGVANIGGALMAEGPQKIGMPLYVEEFHHSLRVNTIALGMPVFLIAPTDPAVNRYIDTVKSVKKWGGYLIVLTDEDQGEIAGAANSTITLPKVSYEMSPLLFLMPLHLFSIELTQHLVDTGYKRPWYSV